MNSSHLFQFALAGMYYGGFGVEQSFTRAFTLYSVRCPGLKIVNNFIKSVFDLVQY